MPMAMRTRAATASARDEVVGGQLGGVVRARQHEGRHGAVDERLADGRRGIEHLAQALDRRCVPVLDGALESPVRPAPGVGRHGLDGAGLPGRG